MLNYLEQMAEQSVPYNQLFSCGGRNVVCWFTWWSTLFTSMESQVCYRNRLCIRKKHHFVTKAPQPQQKSEFCIIVKSLIFLCFQQLALNSSGTDSCAFVQFFNHHPLLHDAFLACSGVDCFHHAYISMPQLIATLALHMPISLSYVPYIVSQSNIVLFLMPAFQTLYG